MKIKNFSKSIVGGKHLTVTLYDKVFYKFNVTLENGEIGEALSSKNESPWDLSTDYDCSISSSNGIKTIKIKKKNNVFQGSGNSLGQRVGMAINNAILLCINNKIKIEDIENAAERIYDIATRLEEKKK